MCFYDTLKSTSQFGKTPSSDKDRMIHTNRRREATKMRE